MRIMESLGLMDSMDLHQKYILILFTHFFNLNSGKDLSIIRLTWPINVGFKDSRTIYQLFYITSVNNDKRNFPSKFRHHFSPK